MPQIEENNPMKSNILQPRKQVKIAIALFKNIYIVCASVCQKGAFAKSLLDSTCPKARCNNNNNITSIALQSSGGPSSEAQQNKIINDIQEPGTYRGHHQFKGPPTI